VDIKKLKPSSKYKNGKYYVKEIIEKAKFPNVTGIKDKIKNFFNDPKNKFVDTDGNTVPLFSIGTQPVLNESGPITPLKTTITSTRNDSTYWFLLRGFHSLGKTESPEFIFGVRIDKNEDEIFKKLIKALKRIAYILSKYDNEKNNFDKVKIEGASGIFFNPAGLEDEETRSRYLVDFTNLSKKLKIIIKPEKYDAIKNQMMAIKVIQNDSPFTIKASFKGTWNSSFTPIALPKKPTPPTEESK
jgi:hypothetical protein